MKVAKSMIGREVRITWKDPTGDRISIDKAKKGRAALSTWIEYGVIDDITDGVVRFAQSLGFSPGMTAPDEAMFGWVPEELIESCEPLVLEEKKE